MDDWKASDTLTPADFERHPLWGYDVERAEADPDSDEAFVRPYAFDAAPGDTDLLFAKAELRTSAGDVVPGAVLFVFESGRPRVAGVALLKPSYLALGLEKGRVTDEDREELPEDTLPLAFEASVDVGGRPIRLSGAAR